MRFVGVSQGFSDEADEAVDGRFLPPLPLLPLFLPLLLLLATLPAIRISSSLTSLLHSTMILIWAR